MCFTAVLGMHGKPVSQFRGIIEFFSRRATQVGKPTVLELNFFVRKTFC